MVIMKIAIRFHLGVGLRATERLLVVGLLFEISPSSNRVRGFAFN